MSEDTSILARIASGDEGAVQDCLDRYGGLVWSIARRLSPTAQDAEDGVQQAFIQIWRSAGRFDPAIASEKTFVAMIARRTVISRLRKHARGPDEVSVETGIPLASDQHERMARGAEAGQLAGLLDVLKPEQRQVLELSVVQGMTHSEISEETGMPLGTVKSHIRRGLQAVRGELRRQQEEAAQARGEEVDA